MASLATGRRECVYLREGLHGRTKWAMSVTGLDLWRTDPNPLGTARAVPGPRHPESLPAVERLLKSWHHATVIAEPIQGNGGIIVPPDHCWPELRRLCSRHGTLSIADEIQTAWNRTGRWFATEHWGVVPDVVTVAKALGNGFPIAAYLTSDTIASHYTPPGGCHLRGQLSVVPRRPGDPGVSPPAQPGGTEPSAGDAPTRPASRVAGPLPGDS